jgi:hypothetical protein
MTEPRPTVAVAVPTEDVRTPSAGVVQSTFLVIVRIGTWAGDTAQQFGSMVAALMAPAVFSAYAFALWSLAGDLGWTDSFVFQTGPLSNWLIWLGIAILVNVAAGILKRRTRSES